MEDPTNFLEPLPNDFQLATQKLQTDPQPATQELLRDDLRFATQEPQTDLQLVTPGPPPTLALPDMEDLPDDEDEPEVALLLGAEEDLHERRVIFISHRQIAGPDQSIANLIEEELLTEELENDFEVYLDTETAGGGRWRENLQDAMDRADFVIALISENSNRNDADWIAFELALAHKRFQRFRRPTIIPVHLDTIEEYVTGIGAALSGEQHIIYNGDNANLIAELRRAIVGGRKPPANVDRLERYAIGDWRTKIVRASLLGAKLAETNTLLEQEKLIWIKGDASARNYLALSLAIKQQTDAVKNEAEPHTTRRIYEVPKTQRWSKVYNSLISDSIIIFNDVVPGILFDEEAQSNELSRLESLVGRNNTIIVTVSNDSYLEILQEMRKRSFTRRATVEVTHQFFNRDDKLSIFDKLLDFASEALEINEQQHAWAGGSEVRQSLNSIIENWSPADIERFVTLDLRQAEKPADVLKLIQRNADLDNEIHSWFVSLDDSTRCFVMVLSLFSDLRQEELWVKYKEVVERLRILNADLSMWPLGICRERASRYVVAEGPLDFTEERVADTIYREIAKNYREYFIELLPLLEAWSVPEGRNGSRENAISVTRRRQAVQTEQLRAATAHMVGKIGQYGLADVTRLVELWATDPIMQVRDAAAQCLGQAASQSFGTKQVFTILDNWTKNRSNGDDALRRAWSAASALGTIATSNSDKPIATEALRRLDKLARDSRTSIRFFVSIPLKRAVRKVELTEEIENLLALVVQDDSAKTKINVAEALNEARVFNEPAALAVINRWLSSDDKNQRWAAAGCVIVWNVWHQRTEETYEEIIRLVRHDAEIVASAFVEIVNHKRHKKKALSLFRNVVLRLPNDARRDLVSGLAKIPFGLLDQRLLIRLKAATQPALPTLAADVRTQRWYELMETPNQLIADLLDELENQQLTTEVYIALATLLQIEGYGSRAKLVAALADSFAENRAGLDRVLRKLKQLASSTFESLVAEVRSGIFERLFHDPAKFVATVTAYLRSAPTAEETARGLDRLAEPGPDGSMDELLQALAAGYALDPAPVKTLFKLFRATSTRRLRHIPFEFNVRLVDGLLSDPAELLAYVVTAMGEPDEFEEFVYVLTEVGTPGPRGKRKMLVAALAEARAINPAPVDQLLLHRTVVAQPSLAGLNLEVRVASTLQNVFVPNIFRKLFTPRR
ncbi:MAG TPA: toll/interleukin-1 receptor domain-containing protein [Pyrinomonadaceae bacterium]|nr:toll/interleukin-1 receptor domain-containing protein [Pyrinomonadaceae bacterium]